MNRWKAIPWVLVGVALLAVSLVAARLNTPAGSANGEKPTAATASGAVVGPTVVGTVDTADGVLPLTPPGVPGMATLTVKKVWVKTGATVAPGDVLVEFDASAVAEKKVQAEQGLIEAEWLADQARRKAELHPQVVEKARLGVKKAESDLASAEKAQKAVSDTVEENLKVATLPDNRTPLSEEQKELRRSRSPELLKANADVAAAKVGVDAAKSELKLAESAPPILDGDTHRANAAVARQRSLVAEATAVIESFKLKAQVGGVIEQIGVFEGMAVSPAARTPLMYLVPAGPRVVRAEVEAEFAHKIDGFVGKTVTVYAGEKYNDAYVGTVRRVSGAFLPKRFGGDSLVGNPTRALECVIDLTDPASPALPPLRPGQPVRVTFGN